MSANAHVKTYPKKIAALVGISILALSFSTPAEAGRADMCGLIGAAGGIAIGSHIGGGNGRIAAEILGGVIGYKVAKRACEREDRRREEEAFQRGFRAGRGPQYAQTWTGSRETGLSGRVYWQEQGYHNSWRTECRKYHFERTVNGQVVNSTTEVRCVDQAGNWTETSESYVVYGVVPVQPMAPIPPIQPIQPIGRPVPPAPVIVSQPVPSAYPPYIVSEHRLGFMMSDFESIPMIPSRINQLNSYTAGFLRDGDFLTLEQVSRLLAYFGNDRSQMAALGVVSDIIDYRLGGAELVLIKFQDPYLRNQASNLINYKRDEQMRAQGVEPRYERRRRHGY